MLSSVRGRIEDLAMRAGLGHLPVPALVAAVVIVAVVACWAALGRGGSGEPLPRQEEYVGSETSTAGAAVTRGESPGAARDASPTAVIVVHVVGAVRRPGVFRLTAGSRGEDAVRAAGGCIGDAAPEAVNLARVLQDGEQLAIPTKDEAAKGPAATKGAVGAGAVAKTGGAKVDINAASEAELDALPGIGPATAAKIVAERDANGPFATVDDLARVPGIGAKKIDGLRDLVTVR